MNKNSKYYLQPERRRELRKKALEYQSWVQELRGYHKELKELREKENNLLVTSEFAYARRNEIYSRERTLNGNIFDVMKAASDASPDGNYAVAIEYCCRHLSKAGRVNRVNKFISKGKIYSEEELDEIFDAFLFHYDHYLNEREKNVQETKAANNAGSAKD